MKPLTLLSGATLNTIPVLRHDTPPVHGMSCKTRITQSEKGS